MTSKHENDLEHIDAPSVSESSRRKALKKMLAGAGMAVGAAALPGEWVKPVVDKVLVPAHAQTSTCEIIPGTYCWSYAITVDLNFYMEITLGANGSVEIATNPFGPNFDPISVPITGGSFTAQVDGATITGEIVCEVDSITGTVEFMGYNVGTVNYTATVDQCV